MLRQGSAKDVAVLPKKVIELFRALKMPPREASFVQTAFAGKTATEEFHNYFIALATTAEIYTQYQAIYQELKQLNMVLQNALVQSQSPLTFQELCLKFAVFSDLFLKHADLNLQLQQLTSLAPLTLPGFIPGITLMDNFTYTRQQMDNLMVWSGYMDYSRVQKWYEQRLSKFPERRTIMELQLGCSGDRFIEMFHFYIKNRIQVPQGPLLSRSPDDIRSECLRIFMTRRPKKVSIEPGEQIMRVFMGATWRIPKQFRQGDVCGYTIDERAYRMQQHQLRMDRERRLKQQQLLAQMMTTAAPRLQQNNVKPGGIFSQRASVRPSGINALGEREKRDMQKKEKTIQWILGATRLTSQPANQPTTRRPSTNEYRESNKGVKPRQEKQASYDNNYQHFLHIQQAMQNQSDEYEHANNFIQEDEEGSFDTSDIEDQQQDTKQNQYEIINSEVKSQSTSAQNRVQNHYNDNSGNNQHTKEYQNIVEIIQNRDNKQQNDEDDEFDESNDTDKDSEVKQIDTTAKQQIQNESTKKETQDEFKDEFDEPTSEDEQQENKISINNYQIVSQIKNSSNVQSQHVLIDSQLQSIPQQHSNISNVSKESESFDANTSSTTSKDQSNTLSKQAQKSIENIPDQQNSSTKSNTNITSEPEVNLDGIESSAKESMIVQNNEIEIKTDVEQEQPASCKIEEDQKDKINVVNYEIIQQTVIQQDEMVNNLQQQTNEEQEEAKIEINEKVEIVQQEHQNAYQLISNISIELQQEQVKQYQEKSVRKNIESREVEIQLDNRQETNKQEESKYQSIEIKQQQQENGDASFSTEQQSEPEDKVQIFTFVYTPVNNVYPNVQEYEPSVCAQIQQNAYEIIVNGIQQQEEQDQLQEYQQVMNIYDNVQTFETVSHIDDNLQINNQGDNQQAQESIMMEKNQMLETIQGSDIKIEQTNMCLNCSENELEYVPVCNSYSFVQQYNYSEISHPVILSNSKQPDNQDQQQNLNPYQIIQQEVELGMQQQTDEQNNNVEENDDHITIADLQKEQNQEQQEPNIQIDTIKEDSITQLDNYQNMASLLKMQSSSLQQATQTQYSLGISNSNEDQELTYQLKAKVSQSDNNNTASQ